MTDACPHCHVPTPGRVLVIEEDDYDRLRALLTEALANEVCAACEEALDTEPAVIAVFPESATALFTPGTVLTDPEVLTGEHLRAYLPPGVVPHIVRCCDQAQLRDQVRRRLVPRLAPVRALLAAARRGDQWQYLVDHWAAFPPPVIAAAGVAATCPDEVLALDVTGTEAGRPMGLDPLLDPAAHERVMVERAVAGLQLWVWLALGADWSAGTRPGELFHDLQTYVSAASVPATGRDLLPEIFTERSGDPYVRAAVQAAVGHTAGLANPRAATWAVLYFTHEIALRLRPDDPDLHVRSVPAWFAAATIDYRAAWAATAQCLFLLADRQVADAAALVQQIAEQAGHPGVTAAVLQENAASPHEPAAEADTLVGRAMALGEATPVPVALAGADLELRSLPDARRAELLDDVAVLLQQRLADRTGRTVVWWAGHHLKDGRLDQADRVLRPLATKATLDPATRARMLGVRAGILAGRGAVDEATGLWQEAESYAVDTGDLRLRYWTRVNLAIRLQETDPDRALEILMDAAYGPDRYGGDHEIFGLMAVLRQRRGETDWAIDLLAEAQHLAQGTAAIRYALQRCQLLIAQRREAEATQILAELTAGGGPADVPALIAESAAWAMLLARGNVPPGLDSRARLMPKALSANAARALEVGSRADFLQLTAARAEFLQTIEDPAAAALWDQLVRLRAEYHFAAEPQELAEAARVSLAAGDPAGMRELLAGLPAALARRYGAAPELVPEPRTLLRPLAETAGLLAAAPEPVAADLRLVGELQRDAVGRARTARRNARCAAIEEPPWLGEPDPLIAVTGPVAVVEWMQTGDRLLRCLLTRIDADGSRAGWLTQTPRDPQPVQRQLLARLQGWTATRSGDPLDDPDWRAVSGHLIEQLETHLGAEDHVVFLHHEAYANLPWHTAIRGQWTVSYAAGWTHLADIMRRPPAARKRLGVCLVPRAADDPATLDGLATARDRLAAIPEVTVTTRHPATNDRAYLGELMARDDVVVLLCHGYRTHDTEDVGVILAAEGLLPPRDDSALARRPQHRYGWRDAARVERAAPTVFSAACSTAHSYGAGLGDRLGLAAALRHGGTAALVAPLWDIRSAETLPVLTAAVERYLTGQPLARTLRAVAQGAAGTGPDWLVWSLALEGDWR